MLIAKEQPVASGSANCIPLSYERPEGCNTGSGSDHNNIFIGRRQPELVVFVYIKFQGAINRQFSQEIRAQTLFYFAIHFKIIPGNGYMYFTAMRVGRRRN